MGHMMIDLDKLTKEELIALIGAMNDKGSDKGDDKAYDPDSLIAMALADPKESRAIAWRRQHPASRAFIVVFGILTFAALIFAGLLFLSV